MSAIRKLAGQTAIYGLSSIIGRFLNYLLTPLYTAKDVFPPEEYGVITNFYAWAAIVAVTLIYGMETSFFRFASRKDGEPVKALSTGFLSVLSTTLIFWAIFFTQREPLSAAMSLGSSGEYVIWFAIIMGLDALVALPMARLRQEGRAIRFASISLVNVLVNIGLNLFFIAYCMRMVNAGQSNALIDAVYDPSIGVGYVFIINVISTLVKAFMLLPYYPRNPLIHFDRQLLGKMLKFTWPLLLIGLAGMINESGDRILIKKILSPLQGEEAANAQVGIYGAVYKLSILIMLFIQAFRYAAEPFFFSKADDADGKTTFAKVMHVFVPFVVGMFLLVVLYLDVFKYFIPNTAFHVGLKVVPILLLANALLGVYYNLSIWYKLSDRTIMGAYISLVGAIITIAINVYGIPRIGYEASAMATLVCFSVMVVLSYLLGRKYYPIPYNVVKVIAWFAVGIAIWQLHERVNLHGALDQLFRASMLLLFAASFYFLEFRKSKKISA